MAYMTYTCPAAKQCRACGLELPLGSFTPSAGCKLGVLPRCKSCMRVASAEYRDQHPEVHRESSARWRASNPEKQRDACKRHYQENKGYYADKNARWQAANPDKCREYSALYYARDPEGRREVWRNHYHRTKLQPLKVLRRRVTSRMHAFLSGLRSGFMREIGCSPECLKQHLELLFPDGMGWHNSDGWEIDHFYPLSAIGDDPSWIDVAAVCNYRNLRPSWKSANRSKKARVLPEAEQLFAAIKDLILVGKQ